MRGENQTPVEVAHGYFGGVGILLLGICFWWDALGAAVGPDRRAGKRGVIGAEISPTTGQK